MSPHTVPTSYPFHCDQASKRAPAYRAGVGAGKDQSAAGDGATRAGGTTETRGKIGILLFFFFYRSSSA